VNGQKMGKSLGNFVTLKDAFAGKPPLNEPVRPMVMRYFVLTSHYRSPLDFSMEALDAAEKGLARIENTVGRVRAAMGRAPAGDVPEAVSAAIAEARDKFLAEMDNDFNSAGAIGVLSTFTREANRLLDAGEAGSAGALAAIDGLYRELGGDILGIVTEETGSRDSAGLESELVAALLKVREDLREAKQYGLADGIRDRLAELGIEVKDGPDGATWDLKA
jgi:cysteinyl-tRNA synthetase